MLAAATIMTYSSRVSAGCSSSLHTTKVCTANKSLRISLPMPVLPPFPANVLPHVTMFTEVRVCIIDSLSKCTQSECFLVAVLFSNQVEIHLVKCPLTIYMQLILVAWHR